MPEQKPRKPFAILPKSGYARLDSRRAIFSQEFLTRSLSAKWGVPIPDRKETKEAEKEAAEAPDGQSAQPVAGSEGREHAAPSPRPVIPVPARAPAPEERTEPMDVKEIQRPAVLLNKQAAEDLAEQRSLFTHGSVPPHSAHGI